MRQCTGKHQDVNGKIVSFDIILFILTLLMRAVEFELFICVICFT